MVQLQAGLPAGGAGCFVRDGSEVGAYMAAAFILSGEDGAIRIHACKAICSTAI